MGSRSISAASPWRTSRSTRPKPARMPTSSSSPPASRLLQPCRPKDSPISRSAELPIDPSADRRPQPMTGRALIRVGALGLSNVGAIVEIDTFYDILGVAPGADDREIKTAFRRLAKLFHPDFNVGDDDA